MRASIDADRSSGPEAARQSAPVSPDRRHHRRDRGEPARPESDRPPGSRVPDGRE
ncbi:Uncharacterised protein [Amycolatopsis camponoti]|uniref:Uncharacterized protein n=1 Tax=Amycolatopsis camponoti TaxID=2606593 RepID=A0A6I8LQ02_9PSEU|nr:Uncharacterised protein [Amycolatopsis camponoti]